MIGEEDFARAIGPQRALSMTKRVDLGEPVTFPSCDPVFARNAIGQTLCQDMHETLLSTT